jgi:hypothetical protein
MTDQYITMYDSATPTEIPRGMGPMIAGYCDGDYAWTKEDWAFFADNTKVIVTVEGNLRANVADVENGDMTPLSAREWIMDKQEENMHGCTVYCNIQTRPAVVYACKGLSYYLWVADWTGEPHQVPGSVAVQYYNDPTQAYDLSAVYDPAWASLLKQVNEPWPL